ncbi:MAG TPA: nitroreductase family deazaflavin-dependent oxidoreductase [Rubrobacteraceae bacterium]|nr:nitroreductase family deazaflavin-dependent oxidoreductase [Rubrobacteraceae bacterium]
MPDIATRLMGIMGKAHSSIYRVTSGRFGGRAFGAPVLLLNTTGRKTGQQRTSPLLYLRDGDDYVIVASKGGTPTHPAWYLNLKAMPETTVEVGGREVLVRAETADPEERARLWPKLIEMYPSYESYQKKTDREIPVVKLHPIER